MISFGLGFLVGWLVFKRPAFVNTAIAWVKEKFVA